MNGTHAKGETMLEAVAVPALLKAVDWIFGESSKVLQERRQRTRAEAPRLPRATSNDLPASSESSSAANSIQTREVALRQPIEETLWKNAEAHVTHLLSLLEIHTANYHLAREQYAKFTSAYAPPIIAHTLTEAENKIVEVTRELQAIMSTIYGKRVTTADIELA